jgi:hypothetical protein
MSARKLILKWAFQSGGFFIAAGSVQTAPPNGSASPAGLGRPTRSCVVEVPVPPAAFSRTAPATGDCDVALRLGLPFLHDVQQLEPPSACPPAPPDQRSADSEALLHGPTLRIRLGEPAVPRVDQCLAAALPADVYSDLSASLRAELWIIENIARSCASPLRIHFDEMRSFGEAEPSAYCESALLLAPNERVRLLVRFRDDSIVNGSETQVS